MNLLRNILIALLLTPLLNLHAQTDEDDIDYIQSVFGEERREIYEEFIQAEGTAGTEFWRLYDDYEARLLTMAKKRFELLDKYADNYDNHTPEQLDQLMRNIIQQKSNVDKLINGYYKKIRKASGPKVAAQFWQMENYILGVTRTAIMETVPFIGELESE